MLPLDVLFSVLLLLIGNHVLESRHLLGITRMVNEAGGLSLNFYESENENNRFELKITWCLLDLIF